MKSLRLFFHLNIINIFRFVRCTPIDSVLLERFGDTVSDRLRIPWRGGALKIPLIVVFNVALVPSLIKLAAVSWHSTLITYTLLLPSLIFRIHRCIRDNSAAPKTATADDQHPLMIKSHNTRSSSLFYPSLLLSCLGWCYYFVMTNVLNRLVVSPLESLVAHCLAAASLTCLFITWDSRSPEFSPPPDAEVDVIDSGYHWRMCNECDKQVPVHSSHCRTCNDCFLHRDHHCLW